MGRNIEDVLNFREDISPFLVHLTKHTTTKQANDVLEEIITSKCLLQGSNKVSDVRWGCIDTRWDEEKKKNLFSAICFTETPLNEIHCLMEINNRQIQLEPYGLVFLKKNLTEKNISPVLYLNNYGNTLHGAIYGLADVVSNAEYSSELHKIFPLFSSIGYKITPRNYRGGGRTAGIYDFSWEREWRLPYCYGDFEIDYENDVFIGLCPHEEIEHFENFVQTAWGVSIPFIDPRRNAKWYAQKLIEQRRKFGLTVSVV